MGEAEVDPEEEDPVVEDPVEDLVEVVAGEILPDLDVICVMWKTILQSIAQIQDIKQL